MKRILSTIASLVSTAMVVGCAGGSAPGNSTLELAQLDDIATGPSQTRPAVLEVDGKPVVLYSTKGGRVALQNGAQRQMMEDTARVKQGGSYFQLKKQGQNLQAFWWSHQDGKNIYIASSTDSGKSFAPVSMVNDEHGVLPPFSLAYADGGVLGMTYHDERVPNYQAYFNRSTDLGRTWARPDQRLDTPPADGKSSNAHEPQLVQLGNVWFSVWTDHIQYDTQAGYRILGRRSSDAGLTWAPAEVLYKSSHQISSLIAKTHDGHVVLAADELNSGVFALSSSDQGFSWKRVGTLGGTDNVNNSGIDMAIANGHVHLVWMRDRTDEKTRIMRGSFDLTQSKWSGMAQRLDSKDFDNTRSTSPVILANAEGHLIAAWADFRDIRSNIYLAVSNNRGETWSYPQPLLKPGVMAAGWPMLLPWQGDAAIAYETYPTDAVTNGKFHVRLLPTAEGGKGLVGLTSTSPASELARKARLEERVNALWKNRVTSNYDAAYDMFDFAYKAATPKKNYLDNVGVITYLTYAIDKLAITGNEANVNMKARYEVKPTLNPLSGKPIELPAIDVEIPTKWVWVADDWFLVYTPSFEPSVLKY